MTKVIRTPKEVMIKGDNGSTIFIPKDEVDDLITQLIAGQSCENCDRTIGVIHRLVYCELCW